MLVGKLKVRARIGDVLVDNIKMDLKTTVCAKVCPGGNWLRAGSSPVKAMTKVRISHIGIVKPT
jgi:hypothetical protein